MIYVEESFEKADPHPLPIIVNTESESFWATYSNVRSNNLPDSQLEIQNLQNVFIKQTPFEDNKDFPYLPILTIEDPCYIITSNSPITQHFELVYDILAEIELIKKEYPDIKIKILNLYNKEPNNHYNKATYIADIFKSKGIFDAYGLKEEDVIELYDFSAINIKSLYLRSAPSHGMSDLFFKNINYFWSSQDSGQPFSEHWATFLINGVRPRFLLEENKNPQKKIFISRMKENNNKRILSEIIQKIVYGYSISEKDNYDEGLLGLAWSLVEDWDYREWVDRTMTKQEEEKLESFFRDAGYEIIDFSDYKTFYEQAKIVNSSKHIVGISGAGFVNACFANSNARVLILNTCDYYKFPHEKVVSSFGLEVSVSPRRRVWQSKRYSAKEIIASVKRNHSSFLDMV
jgi:hypothetical protein